MDAILKLTDAQYTLVEQLRGTIDLMRQEHVEMLLDEDGFLFFYNGFDVEDIHWPEYSDDSCYRMEIGSNLPCVEIGAVKINYEDDYMGIQFKEQSDGTVCN